MKRINGLYEQITDIGNLRLADQKARKGKMSQYGVMTHDRQAELNLTRLQFMLKDRTYRTSEYSRFTIYDPKEREIFRLPYFPDRITHHAVMNVLEPIFVSTFTSDTYSCIKGKGIHAAARSLRKALNDTESTKYCLKMDIRKFYPSIDHEILKSLLRRKFKDVELLWLLDEIIESTPGIPIGNYLSQYFANFYLSYFDHWIKESQKVKYYFRYADDIVILSSEKSELHRLLGEIRRYFDLNLKLQVKDNYQVFPVDSRGIDFVGYVFYHTHTRLRKTIKKNLFRMINNRFDMKSFAAYNGWLKHCDSKNLKNKILKMKSFSELGIQAPKKGLEGDKIKIERVLNREIQVHDFRIVDSKFEGKGKCLHLQIMISNTNYVVFTGSNNLMEMIQKVDRADFPFKTTIIRENERFQFS